MGIGKVLGSISPLAGAVTGKGAFGKGLSKLADSGLGMMVPMSYLAKSQRDKAEREKAERAASTGQRASSTMKKGGTVKKMAAGGSASKRGDGIAKQGKTKGRFV